MKLLIVLAVLGAAAAAEDQKAEDATYISTYAASTYPLTYTAGYPYNAYSAIHAPTVYNAGYSRLAYNGFYNGVYPGYAAPLVHSLKKRDVAAAEEDQKAEDATYISTYAAHPYPLTYTAGYPYSSYGSYAVHTPASTAPLAYAAPLAYRHHYGFY